MMLLIKGRSLAKNTIKKKTKETVKEKLLNSLKEQ